MRHPCSQSCLGELPTIGPPFFLINRTEIIVVSHTLLYFSIDVLEVYLLSRCRYFINFYRISSGAIYDWLKKRGKSPGANKSTSKWASEDKFHIVLETSPLTEEELAAYCRKKGVYPEEVKKWKEQCKKANDENYQSPKALQQKLDDALQLAEDEKQRANEFKKELHVKEKALAETAALLVLRKKATAIWGDLKVDRSIT